MIYETLHFLLPLLPEAFLTICAMCALCAGVYSRVDLRKTNADMLVWFGLCGSLVLIFLLRENTSGSDDGLFMADGYANFSRLAIFLLSAVSLSFGQSWLKYKNMCVSNIPFCWRFRFAEWGLRFVPRVFCRCF